MLTPSLGSGVRERFLPPLACGSRLTGRFLPETDGTSYSSSSTMTATVLLEASIGVDVTDQYSDLQARLNSDLALRDRLRQLVDRATTLDEILNLEQQIARLQADIDGLQSRIDRLKTQTELAALSVSLDKKYVLGPLAIAGRGVAGLFAKLFVVR
jgi:uncharacterized protein YlxW (UPF0749 family)